MHLYGSKLLGFWSPVLSAIEKRIHRAKIRNYDHPLPTAIFCTVCDHHIVVPWAARRSNQSILKEINPEYSLEGLMLKLKLQYFGHLMQRADWLTGKDCDAGKDWRQEEKGTTEDEMVGWHHWLNGHEFKQAPGDGEGQGSLACCSPWGCKESDMTEWLNNSKRNTEE